MTTRSIDSKSVDALVDDVAGHLNAQHGRLIDVAIWLLQNTTEWQGDGLWTAQQYLAWRAGVSPATASNLVTVAERADEFPVAVEKVRRGEMSIDQLMPIVRTVPGWADAQITSLAHRLTVSQVRRLVRETNWAWTPGSQQPGADAEPADDEAEADGARPHGPDDTASDLNRVNYGFGDDGRWYLHADLDADLGAEIHESLDEARDALFRQRNHSPSSTPGAGSDQGRAATDPNVLTPATDAEAFVEIARRAIDSVESQDRRDRYRINLFLGLNGDLTTARHIALPDSLRDLVTCDGRIDPVFVDGATPVSIGRSSRVIPDRLRRTVLHRDHGCCQVPGCTATRRLDLHHIVHWSRGGPTDSANLITVCSRHHRMHHKRHLGIRGNADDPASLEFTDRHGLPIRASGANPTRPSGPPPPIAGSYEHPIGERLDPRWVTFVDPSVPPGQPLQRSDVAG